MDAAYVIPNLPLSGWTWLKLSLVVVAYQVIVPRFAEKLAHKFVILAIDALTMLFWFAGFIALAVDVRFVTGPTTDWYKAAQATVAFAAFSWYELIFRNNGTKVAGLTKYPGSCSLSPLS